VEDFHVLSIVNAHQRVQRENAVALPRVFTGKSFGIICVVNCSCGKGTRAVGNPLP